jgi:serpin B
MGMKDAFMPGKADFSGMATGEKLHITAVLHKAFVDVNEKGTEAAAATAIGIGTTSLPQPGVFHCDRPFVFVIRDHRNGTILFMGRVANPAS